MPIRMSETPWNCGSGHLARELDPDSKGTTTSSAGGWSSRCCEVDRAVRARLVAPAGGSARAAVARIRAVPTTQAAGVLGSRNIGCIKAGRDFGRPLAPVQGAGPRPAIRELGSHALRQLGGLPSVVRARCRTSGTARWTVHNVLGDLYRIQ